MNIAIFGAKGRVGSAVCTVARQRKHAVCEIDVGVPPDETFRPEAVIDFSLPVATQDVVDYCAVHNCPLITGVTGRNKQQQALIDSLATQLPVRQSANFAQGMQAFIAICREFAKRCPDWDVDIVETHRRNKLDAPAGTAKKIAALIAKQRGTFTSVVIHSLRSGSNFGRHEVIFGGQGESVTLVHQAESVEVFALGAVKCAEKLIPG